MNLTKVKDHQQQAYKKFSFWRSVKTAKWNRKLMARDLYTFFDEQLIVIEIHPEYDLGDNYVISNRWYYTINNGSSLSAQDFNNEMYLTRSICEEAAFFRSFELLEEKCKRITKKINIKKVKNEKIR